MFELPYILFLVPFSLYWWMFILVTTALAFWAIDDEDTISGIITLTIFSSVIAVVFGTGVSVLEWAYANPWHVLGGAVGYLGVGVGWCLYRWYSLVRRARKLYQKLAAEYTERDRREDKPTFIARHWTFRKHRDDEGRTSFRPTPGNYKARITNWIAYWPLSVIWIGIREWVVDFLNMVYRAISGVLERISLNTWDGIDE
jgi:hypothetical protein